MKIRISQILPHLFVGRHQDSLNHRDLKALGITHILNVMDSAKFHDEQEFCRLHVPVSDFGDTELFELFTKTDEFIDSAKSSGGKVLLHCGRGQNRSPTVATAYLMGKFSMNLSEAFKLVREKRPEFAPHEKYLAQLQELDRKLFGSVSLTEDDEPLSIQAIARKVLSESKDRM